jgi:protein-tyrosine phosphatase
MSYLTVDSIRSISPKLYIGDYLASLNYNILLQLNITHILVCGEELTCRFPKTFTYKHLKIDDSPVQSLKEYFEEAYQFIQKGMQKGKVLVHCAQAKSRSVSMVLSYLMKSQKLRFTQAFSLLKKKHPQADPIPAFRQQLLQYEKEILPDSSCMIF